MTRSLLVVAMLAVASSRVAAQPAAQPAASTTPTDSFLEQRVAEALAAEGTLLSRLGVELYVHVVSGPNTAVNGTVIVSLVDPTTRHALASTKLDSLPAEREAAVAAVTVVASNLVDQLTASRPAAATTAAAAVQTVLQDERAHREAREQAEYRYQREAITFGSEVSGTSGKATVRWRPYQGGRPLEPEEMFLALGRKDLADDIASRRTAVKVGVFGGALGVIVGAGVLINSGRMDDGDGKTAMQFGGVALGIAGVIGIGVGLHAMFTLPYSEGDLYDMADKHNTELRKKYGLPTTSARETRTTGTSVVVAPYATGDGGGLSIAGRF